MKGGYKVVDFKKTNLTSTRVTDFGIAEQLEANVGKAVLLTNVKLNDAEMDDCFSTVIKKSENNFKLNCYDGYISITSSGVKYSSASVENLAEDLEELTEKVGDLDDLETTDKDSVVDAVNEVNTATGNLQTKIGDLVNIVTIQAANTGVINTDTASTISAFDISASIPTGYKVIGCYPQDAGDDGFLISGVVLSDNNTKLAYVVRNVGVNSHSGTPKFALICIKE